jgi:hypothetical protein
VSLNDQDRTTAKPTPFRAGERLEAPPIADVLGLDAADRESGVWHDDFLWLGSRLRQVYGNRITIAVQPPTYQVSFPNEVVVSVSCPLDNGRAQCIRISAPVIDLSHVAVPGIFEFVLRENADLNLARIGLRDGWLVAEHELAVCGACVPALEASASAVRSVASKLKIELSRGFGLSAA